ncbi:hypothetical protein B296_00049348 [Ensete ventricosum]|uniref:Transposase (putative) gypsy type domain-containing protein n=1 Tax=Ensete ventricosum TaxID=4639 RepID=A0A426WWS2_ENSVE|nr:hypothetical protein B296_00049348 [Ensete ventricosum]
MCILVDALEADLRFPLHPLIEECLRRWRISPSQVAPNSWLYLVVFLGECRGAGIIPTRDLFMACFRLCKSRGNYYLIARVGFRVSGAPSNNKGWKSCYLYVSGLVWGFRLDWSAHPIGNAPPYLSEEETVLVGRLKGILSSSRVIKEMAELWLVEAGLSLASRDRMDLGELRGMPKVASGKAPPTRPTAREVDASPVREVPKALSKRPVVTSIEQAEDAVRHHKKVKVLTRRHKSRPGEGESRSRSKGMEPTTPSKELEAPAGSEEGALHRPMSNNSSTAEEFERGLLHPQLARELYTLPSEVLMARAAKEMVLAVAKAEEHASELREELEKTKRERGEELLRREASEKELHEIRSHLGDAQWLLKEARVRAWKMDDELLQAVKDLESARAELPRQSIVQYKDSLDFKEGLKRMGRVTYEYGYRVVLAHFLAQHPNAEVEEDPFTIHPKDDLVPMER